MPNIFDKPFVNDIDRSTDLQQNKSTFKGSFDKGPAPLVEKKEIIDDIRLDNLDTKVQASTKTIFQDPFLKEMVKTMDKIIDKANIVEKELEILQAVQIRAVDLNLDQAPKPILDIIAQLTEEEYGPGKPLDPDIWECITQLANLNGEDLTTDTLNDLKDDAEKGAGLADVIEKEAKKKSTRIDGWTMFIFFVKFILAYSVHMSLGFLCCYFKGKLKVARIKVGDKISGIIGTVERSLKALLGFPCGSGSNPCVDENGKLSPNPFMNMFPCCDCNGSSVKDVDRPSFKQCVSAIIDDDFRKTNNLGPQQKPCRLGNKNPLHTDDQRQEMAATVVDYMIEKSNMLDLEGKNKANVTKTNGNNTKPIGQMLTTAKLARSSAVEMKVGLIDAWDKNTTLNKNSEDCEVLFSGGMSGLNKNPADWTEEDIGNALLANIDIDFTDELAKANAGRTSIEFDLSNPPETEPFASIYGAVKTMDDALSGILDEARTFVGNVKTLTNFTISRSFCCVIFSIAFLGNLIKFHKLCPEEGVEELFKYASKLENSGDLKKMVKWLKLLKEVIQAINAELAIDLQIIGIGLPLGSLVALLKKVVSNSIMALMALAFAPLDRMLRQLQGANNLKELLNNNCFGIGDIFAMFQCALQWIFDLVKEWAEGLITLKAQNIELISDMRIGNARLGFLSSLSDLIDLLLDLLLNIGDCYTPDVIVDEILGAVDQEAELRRKNMISVLEDANVSLEDWDNIGTEVRNEAGDIIFEDDNIKAIEEFGAVKNNPRTGAKIGMDNSFPIFPAEMVRFKQQVIDNNAVPLARNAGAADAIGLNTFDEEILQDISGGITREQARADLLNMVDALSNISAEL